MGAYVHICQTEHPDGMVLNLPGLKSHVGTREQ